MIRRLFLLMALSVMMSGCYMVPMAFIGPVTSGFSTASIIQSSFSAGTNYMVKKTTGKTVGQHAIDAISNSNEAILKQSYFPKDSYPPLIVTP